MTYDSSALDSYLEEFARKPHQLGRLVADGESRLKYTPSEIAQQPFLWRHTARQMRQHAPALHAFLKRAGLYDARCRPQIVLTGAGTSDYVGLSLSDLLRRHFHTASSNWPSTRITASPDAFLMHDDRSFIMHFGRSGDSPESSAVLNLTLEHFADSAHHLVVTCNENGALANIARANSDRVYLLVLHEACNDRGLAMTSSFTNMIVAGQALVHLEDMDGFIELIDHIADAGEYLIDTFADAIYQLASPRLKRIFYLGNNDLLGAATESALKVQELTVGMMTAMGEDTLAFRHGPVSAVDGDTMVCFFLSQEPYTRKYEVDVLTQYQQPFAEMGVQTVVLNSRPPEAVLAEGVVVIAYDPELQRPIPPLYQVNLATLFGQMFAVFSSYRRKINVDNPSISKALYSRTVQGVRLYAYTPGSDAQVKIESD